MNIKVEIKKILKGDKPTKAYANIVIDDAVVIHGVGVVENEKGRYMSMPMTSWKTAKGEEVTRPVFNTVCSLFCSSCVSGTDSKARTGNRRLWFNRIFNGTPLPF